VIRYFSAPVIEVKSMAVLSTAAMPRQNSIHEKSLYFSPSRAALLYSMQGVGFGFRVRK
jgi:hypothetical protein